MRSSPSVCTLVLFIFPAFLTIIEAAVKVINELLIQEYVFPVLSSLILLLMVARQMENDKHVFGFNSTRSNNNLALSCATCLLTRY